jgi:hypothetical protein
MILNRGSSWEKSLREVRKDEQRKQAHSICRIRKKKQTPLNKVLQAMIPLWVPKSEKLIQQCHQKDPYPPRYHQLIW